MGTPKTYCEPFPDCILDAVGLGFVLGAVGGSLFHFIKGIYNSQNGSRFIGCTQAVRMDAPRIGGRFAVWGGLYTIFASSMPCLHQKEDGWNSIIGSAATVGFLSMRQGLAIASRSVVFDVVIFALIEGAEIMLNKLMEPPIMFDKPMPAGLAGPSGVPHEVTAASKPSSSSSSWFGGWFGW